MKFGSLDEGEDGQYAGVGLVEISKIFTKWDAIFPWCDVVLRSIEGFITDACSISRTPSIPCYCLVFATEAVSKYENGSVRLQLEALVALRAWPGFRKLNVTQQVKQPRSITHGHCREQHDCGHYRVCVCEYVCMHMCIHMCAYMHEFICACMHVCVCMCVCTCLRVCMSIDPAMKMTGSTPSGQGYNRKLEPSGSKWMAAVNE